MIAVLLLKTIHSPVRDICSTLGRVHNNDEYEGRELDNKMHQLAACMSLLKSLTFGPFTVMDMAEAAKR